MTDRYDDILNLSPPDPIRERMSLESRAAQFAPFAALTGHDEALAETTRLTTQFTEPGEFELMELSRSVSLIMMQNREVKVEVQFFVADSLKDGGKYVTHTGAIRRIDEYTKVIVFRDDKHIPISTLTSISIID